MMISKSQQLSNELPKGWRRVAVKDMSDSIQYGHTASAVQRDDGPRFLRITDIQGGRVDWNAVPSCNIPKDEIPKYKLAPGDLVFARTGATTGKSFLIGDCPEAVFASYLIRVRVSADVDSRYLATFFQSPDYWQQIEGGKRGIGQPNVNGQILGQVQFPLAPPIEQRRIVAEIEKQFTRLEAGVAALRRVQANLKRYRAAVLKAACAGQLVPTEAAWPQKQIATAIQTMDQGWSPKCESEPSADDATWAVIKTTAIQNLRFDEVENKKLPVSLKPRPHLELQLGDLLVTRAGPRNRVGVACLVKSTRPRLMLCDKAYRLRCKPSVVLPAFLELVLNAPHIVDAVNELKTGISDSGVNLTQKRFGELIVPLPPLADQTRIVAEVERRLSVVEELETVVSANLQRATRLRQSILQKAFTGEL
jgi:type I restriction enzyme, S subunit